MPFYTFKCPSCNQEKEILQSIISDKLICERCVDASCGIHIPKMKRVWKKTAKPQFKGNGFYETDYKNRGTGKMKDFKILDDDSNKSHNKDMGVDSKLVQYKPLGKKK